PSNIEVSKMRFKVTEKTLSSLLGTRRTAEKGFGTEFVAIREYHPGDDIRNIDWKASARLNKMMMRTFQVERKQRIFLLLDVGQNMNLHNSMIDSSVYSSIYLSQLIISRKDVLGFGLFSDTLKTFISHVKTRQHLMNLVKQIAMQTFDKKTDYVACLKRMGVAAKKRCAIILITNIMEESPEELLQAFKYLANHSVHIICPYEPYFEAKSDDLLEKVVYRIALHRYEMKFQERANILKQLGINCYRVGPDNIGIKLTQIYLSIVKKDLALV
ncbi:MAG: DUF58 domain-containing protein, partial [Nanoarchaeota archaeon]|nr:DUF58 domain-containing protein [Nanoarchaeota archaeon]